MLFPEEDAPQLKTWIVKRIENTSDADSDVLADYVIALLKHDGDAASVRALCEAEIPDFLTEATDPKTFLDDVFQAIAYKSYRPGAPSPPKPTTSGAIGVAARPLPSAQGVQSSGPHHTGSRKRGFHDDGEHDGPASHGRSHKQPRRGSNHGRMDDSLMGGQQGSYVSVDSMPGMSHFDPRGALEAIMQMQAMGIPYPGMAEFMAQMPHGGGRTSQRRRGRCRDFDTKGYCSRGNQCMYDHGNSSIYVPNMLSQIEEYDPNNAVLSLSALAANPYQFPMETKGRGRGRGGRGGKKGGARASFSAEGPVHDRSKSTIVVENIPEENFNEDEVRAFFSQFGEIVEVSMQPYKHLAIVKYDKWASANAAYRSPKVIFDNRFVKVFWYKDDDAKSSSKHGDSGPSKINGDGPSAPAEAEPEIDMEEFQRRQEEAQKQHQDKETKRTELERQRQELEKQQQELLAKHREESERLKARLGEKSGDAKAPGSSSSTDTLRAQLAALEQEAKILGIDPNMADDGGSSYSSRGRGYMGRGGRGSDRGFAPRGRGSFRGQAGRHAAYAQYSLDNRPRKLAVTGVDFTPADKDELLRHFLLNLGEFESVETTPTVTNVSFQDRKTAEKFYYSLHGKELPGVEGTLDLSWVNTPLPPVGASKKIEDVGDGDAMAGMNDDEEEGEVVEDLPEKHMQGRQVDMDYDVGDDEGWAE
ncbi:hypothetical protein M441DRAFT_131399 [Trichoderma asperellum CBS 433.97]|uniref:CCCH zinc finger and RRM domain-containing protein n=1 Tax=Trichoderma asperellum (strain ATCC 204424 / CBS 433.97 / NBRC 101777) TaxID=1042311 RepID=A0A2T3ZLT8_TRIA4|nr:hypothetical protein M441DRAFT_131399 [Trichoderma asperellum CBS 433.97]PTB45768.1 hypothetical protein M441DRAFT_131399 [Trichoderma asperellum CBS 433.97]